MNYRPELDGLRAFAVLPVLLFHLGVPAFAGGYVGVDVFFVISGYLITGLMLREMETGRLSLTGFWERRARRILPALSFMVFACVIAGWFILFPKEFREFGWTVAWQAIFAVNFLFWEQAEYFAAPAETMPLLHTWSLAVEEQFYIVWPILLLLASRHLPDRRTLLVAFLALVSLAFSIHATQAFPTAAFFLPHSRAWELLLGALIAFHPNLLAGLPAMVRSAIGAAGLALVLFAILSFDKATAFPGAAALIPCIGTAAVILATVGDRSPVRDLLSWRPFVAIGLISYSLYLWHWPLIVFAREALGRGLSATESIAVVVASFLAAYVSWKLVETPFRRKRLVSRPRQIALAAVVSGAALVGAGFLIQAGDGYAARFPEPVNSYLEARDDREPWQRRCHGMKPRRLNEETVCKLGSDDPAVSPSFAVWGDSHAQVMLPALAAAASDAGLKGIYLGESCPPIEGIYKVVTGNECFDYGRVAMQLIASTDVRDIVMISRWAMYPLGFPPGDGEVGHRYLSEDPASPGSLEESKDVFRRKFLKTAEALHHAGRRIWIVRQTPLQQGSPPKRLAHAWLDGRDRSTLGAKLASHRERQRFVEGVFAEARDAGIDVRLLDPAGPLCDADGFCPVDADGRSLYRDDDHVSRLGAFRLKPLFNSAFEEIARR